MNKLFYSVIIVAIATSSCTVGNKQKTAAGSESPATGDALTIIATLKANPEFKDELWNAVLEVVKGTRTETGNISYNVYVDTTDPLQWTFIENWKSQAAINDHNTSEHFRTFAKTVEGKAELSVSILKHKL
jgi:quinol monooxygenase YgiN